LLKEKGGRLGLVHVVILSLTTHPLQYRSFEIDMQETSATEVCESPSSFCLRERECAKDLLLKEKGGRLGLVPVVILSMTTHPLQYRSLELDMQETSATEVCECPSSSPSLNLCQGNVTPTVPGFRADMQEMSATVVHVSFLLQDLAIPPSISNS
jgi:hypothetical protein